MGIGIYWPHGDPGTRGIPQCDGPPATAVAASLPCLFRYRTARGVRRARCQMAFGFRFSSARWRAFFGRVIGLYYKAAGLNVARFPIFTADQTRCRGRGPSDEKQTECKSLRTRRELATSPAWVLSRGIAMVKTENRNQVISSIAFALSLAVVSLLASSF